MKNWYEKLAFFNQSGDIRQLITHYTNIYGLLHHILEGKNESLFCQYVAQKKVSGAAICYIMKFGNFSKAQLQQLHGIVSYLLFQGNMIKRALRVVEEGLSYYPLDSELLSNKGCILLALQQKAMAKETFLKIENPSPEVQKILGQL